MVRAVKMGFWVVLNVAVVAGVCRSQELDPEPQVLEFWQQVSEVLEAVRQHHPLPPTQQELLARGLGAIQAGQDGFTYAEVVRRVSEAAPSTLKAICCEAWEESVAQGEASEEVTQRFMAGMIDATPGPVRWIPAKEAEVTRQLQENRYVGIGISLAWNEEQNKSEIREVFYGGPAWKAKLERGDRFVTIDGKTAVGVGLRDVITRLRGPLDTELSVEVDRGTKKIAVDMTRLEVPIATVEGVERQSVERWQVSTRDDANHDDANLGYLKLVRVAGSTATEMRSLLRQAREQGCQGLILDLRQAVTGNFHQTTLVADHLCAEGVMGSRRVEGRVEEVRSITPGDWTDRPLVILAPERASAELVWLVDAVQQSDNVKVVGQAMVTDGFLSENVELASGSLLENLPHGFLLVHDTRRLGGVVNSRGPFGSQAGLKPGRIGMVPDVEAYRSTPTQGYDPEDAMIQEAQRLLKEMRD